MALKIGTNDVKKMYRGTSLIKLIYLDKNLIYANPQVLTVTLGDGVASVGYSAKEINGVISSGTINASTRVKFGFGTTVTFTPIAKSGYTLDSYTASVYMSIDRTVSFTAS